MAAHPRAGVQGMSMRSPPWVACSASITALPIAGGAPPCVQHHRGLARARFQSALKVLGWPNRKAGRSDMEPS